MLILTTRDNYNKFPDDVYGDESVNFEIIKEREFKGLPLAYFENNLVIETNATEFQLIGYNIQYEIIDEIPIEFKQLVTKTEEYGEYLSYIEIKTILNI